MKSLNKSSLHTAALLTTVSLSAQEQNVSRELSSQPVDDPGDRLFIKKCRRIQLYSILNPQGQKVIEVLSCRAITSLNLLPARIL